MKIFWFTLFFFLLCTVCYAQTSLGYSLKKDDIFTIKQDAQQIITQIMDGAEHEITDDINGVLEFRMIDEKNDNCEIAMRFKDLNLKMTSSIQGELMNVQAKEVSKGDLQSKMFNSLLDIPIQMTLAKNGDIVNISGGHSLIIKMVTASGILDELQMNMMKKGPEKEFGSEVLSNSFKQMTYIYSDEIVNPGDSWENEYTGKLNSKNTWTFDGLENDSPIISGIAAVIMTVDDGATKMNLNGSQQTKIITDRASGCVKSITVEGTAEALPLCNNWATQRFLQA